MTKDYLECNFQKLREFFCHLNTENSKKQSKHQKSEISLFFELTTGISRLERRRKK